MKIKAVIKRGQIWKQRTGNRRLIICGIRGGKWMAKTLTDKPGIYGDTHRIAPLTLRYKYELEHV